MSDRKDVLGDCLSRSLDKICAASAMAGKQSPDHPAALTFLGFNRLRELAFRPVRIAVLGEANVGKTTLVNRFLGQDLLPTSVVTNTIRDVRIMQASGSGAAGSGARQRHGRSDDRAADIEISSPWLNGIELVDTRARAMHEFSLPSMGDEARRPPADIIVWCTNATRAWGESERRARTAFAAIGRARALLVATHVDGLKSSDARDAVASRLNEEAAHLFAEILMPQAGHEAYADLRRAVLKRVDQFRLRRRKTVARLAGRLSKLSLAAMKSSSISVDFRSSELEGALAGLAMVESESRAIGGAAIQPRAASDFRLN